MNCEILFLTQKDKGILYYILASFFVVFPHAPVYLVSFSHNKLDEILNLRSYDEMLID